MPLFITFEGGEGCGKSTQSRALQRRLDKLAIPVILIREPGGTPLGERVRSILKHATATHISALSELILFNASRSQLVSDIIKPALAEGKIVLCDRFTDSTLAYQSYGRGLDLSLVKEINRIAAQGLQPDLTFLLDVPPETGLARKKGSAHDRFEKEELEFHRRVRAGFMKLANCDRRWSVIDATQSPGQVTGQVWDVIRRALSIRNQS
jgi:dTMP kinase